MLIKTDVKVSFKVLRVNHAATRSPSHSRFQVVAIVMDLLTDLQIIQDLLDAASRRGVAVYAVLEARGLPHFLDMCSRLQINAPHLRVRRGGL